MARTQIAVGVVVAIVFSVAFLGFIANGRIALSGSSSQTLGTLATTYPGASMISPAPIVDSATTTYTTLTNGECTSVDGLPDPRCTPGAINPEVNQSDIYSTICVRGWTATVRPNETYTEDLKKLQIGYYGYSDTYLSDYEEDHLIPLEVGGSPTSPLNLWPQSHYGNYTSYDKDSLEDYVNAQVCDGKMTLTQGQQVFTTNWVYYWRLWINKTSTTANGD